MDTYSVVIYLHLLSLFIGFGAISIVWLCLFRLRDAQTQQEATSWAVLTGSIEKAFPVAVVGLFGTGAYMTSDRWTWSTSWIQVSIVGLVLVALQGPLIAGRRAHQLKAALRANGPGPLGEVARRITRDPLFWIANFSNPGMVLGIVWNMTQKPGVAGSIAAVAGGYAVGTVLALWLARAPGPAAETARGPA